MINLLKAEFYKLKGNKLLLGLLFASIIPFLLSAIFVSDFKGIEFGGKGTFSLLRYVSGTITVLSYDMPIGTILLALCFNSFISEEINSDRIIYQVIGKKMKAKLYAVKMLLGIGVTLTFNLLTSLFAIIGYYVFIFNTEIAGSSDDRYYGKMLFFYLFYVVCFQIIAISLSFLGMEKVMVCVMFLLAIVTANLSQNAKLYTYFPGSIAISDLIEKNPNISDIMANQYLLLTFIALLFIFISRTKFLKREF
ncbi:hypothetical protein RyT2_04130 [Pseudolactococcus yaeyamensis]